MSLQDNEWNYTINRTDDQQNSRNLDNGYKGSRYKGRELFITNYDLNSVRGIKSLNFEKNNPENNSNLQLTLF